MPEQDDDEDDNMTDGELRRKYEEDGARRQLETHQKRIARIIELYPQLAEVNLQYTSPSRRTALLEEARQWAAQGTGRKERKTSNRHYSEKFKRDCLAKVVAGESPANVAKKQNISNVSLLYLWSDKFGIEIRKKEKKAGMAVPVKALPKPLALKPMSPKYLKVLKAIPDEGAIHFEELSGLLKLGKDGVHWHLRNGRKAGEVEALGKGMWKKTQKGKVLASAQ